MAKAKIDHQAATRVSVRQTRTPCEEHVSLLQRRRLLAEIARKHVVRPFSSFDENPRYKNPIGFN